MKKDEEADELRPEYDFGQMTRGVRGKYTATHRRGANLARLDPDVAKAFTTDQSVNEALRALLKTSTEPPDKRAAAQEAASRRR
jgi:hypothetical protein